LASDAFFNIWGELGILDISSLEWFVCYLFMHFVYVDNACHVMSIILLKCIDRNKVTCISLHFSFSLSLFCLSSIMVSPLISCW
jgi:hypothetical protein